MKHAKFAALAAALAALPVQAELLNPGADMELGETGKPVPGWMLTLNRIDRKLLRTQPDTFFTTETVMEKGRGRVLLVPYRPGMYDLSLVCGEMNVPADGEVEVAFDARNVRTSASARISAATPRSMSSPIRSGRIHPIRFSAGSPPTRRRNGGTSPTRSKSSTSEPHTL